jgi:hypothetical protein
MVRWETGQVCKLRANLPATLILDLLVFEKVSSLHGDLINSVNGLLVAIHLSFGKYRLRLVGLGRAGS